MITIIDETVILRYLLNDEKRQSAEARRIIEQGDAYTYPEIIARVVVVLRDVYRVPRSLIGRTIVRLLDDVTVAEEEAVRLAARSFGTTLLDFTDCMVVARNTLHGYRVKSFDKPMMKKTID
ncbi:MAG: type II toxin-antitoxin system VapC family toxin [Slackia sp.]|nr:type II toxin-antitoxin system VapC family toxin [Slackia sp.]